MSGQTAGMTANGPAGAARPFMSWWPLLVGLLLLYGPTYVDLATGPWGRARDAHGPLILAAVLYAFWRELPRAAALPGVRRPVLGAVLFGGGLLLYVLGRSQSILVLEIGSQLPVVAGLLLWFLSARSMRALWFPLVFMIFLVPIPGPLLDWATLPLKNHVSVIVDDLLFAAGYPVARSGVVLTIGPYQVLIADACSGLNSMYTLTALGVFYIYLRGHASPAQNVLLLLAAMPIAFAANIGRVLALMLITWYLGDAAGRSFLHDFAGFTDLAIAVLLLVGFDGALGAVFRRVEGGRRAAD